MDAVRVAVVGAGPAGIATAIQLQRSGVDPLLLEENHVGGLLRNAHLVENYPGFPDGIPGTDLVDLFKRQLARVGVQVRRESVLEAAPSGRRFELATAHGVHASDILVVATGTKPNPVPGLMVDESARRRVLYEIHSIRHLADQRIAIIGAGDAAFDYALSLSCANEVIILSRSTTARCIPLLEERCHASSGVTWHRSVVVTEVRSEGGTLLLRCSEAHGGTKRVINADFLLIAVGRKPSVGLLGPAIKEQLASLVRHGRLYLVGDVKNGPYRQTAIAVGDGIRTAMRIVKSLHGGPGADDGGIGSR